MMKIFTGISSRRHEQRGLSLIELMIALLLGVVLGFAAVNLFLRSKISYLEDEEYGRLQENGRYALRYISREMSMAGFLGGVFRGGNITTSISGSNCVDYLLDTTVPFVHQNSVTADGAESSPGDDPVNSDCLTLSVGTHQPGTDLLVLRRTTDTPHVVEGTLQSGLSIVDTDIYLRKQEYNESLTLVPGSQANYSGQQVDIWRYEPQVLFIRNWSRQEGDGVPALCRKRLPSDPLDPVNSECLVEGVEDIQLEFGLDEDNDLRADRFVAAPTASQIERAVAARIYLLMRSVNAVTGYTNDRSYTLGSKAVPAANDGFYRRVFQTTVLLRNSEVFKY